MKNFLLLKDGIKAFAQFSQGVDFFKYLTEGKFFKTDSIWTPGNLKIKAISEKDYLGYVKKETELHNDLLFTKTFLQQIQPWISRGLIRVLYSIAANEFNIGKRFREQGDMKSLLVPGSRQQKVIEFCPARISDVRQSGYILMGVNVSIYWNSHGKSWSQREEREAKVYKCQQSYAIYQKWLGSLR